MTLADDHSSPGGAIDPPLAELRAFADRLADAARAETAPRFRDGAAVFNKAGIWFDPVTDADREAERVMRRMIEAMYPEHGVLGEEFGETTGAGDWRWVLDPVDGTRAFVCGAPTWMTLIGLERAGTPTLGVIDQPFTDERWVGVAGETTYRRGETVAPARVSGLEALGKARLATTDPRRGQYFSEAEAAAFERLAGDVRLARFGMDAYAYALLAIGEFDLVVESGLQRYDYCALVPVVEGAGGVFTNWDGDPPGADDRGRTLAAASPALHEAALAILANV